MLKERMWKAERDMEVMRQERDKMRVTVKEKDDRQDTYLSGWMKTLKIPISAAIWGEQKICGPLVRDINGMPIQSTHNKNHKKNFSLCGKFAHMK